MELVAYLKLGMAMDVIEFNDVKTLDKLIIDAQPANLVKIANHTVLMRISAIWCAPRL